MKKILLSSLAASTLAFGATKVVDITPTVSYVDTKEHVDIKNHTMAGVSVGLKRDNCKFDKLEVSLLQSIKHVDYENSLTANTSLTRFSFNGIKEYGINDTLSLYGLVGLGYEYISNELFRNESGSFFNYGLGVAYKLQNNYKLKFDIRHELKFDDDRDVLYTIGLSIPFGFKVQKEAPKPISKPISKPQDSDKDSVNDIDDMCPQTAPNTKVDAVGCALPQKLKVVTLPAKISKKEVIIPKPESLKVLFDTNKATIKSIDMEQINKYADYLQKVPTAKILLTGYTDSDGDSIYNLDLSHKRADAVKAKLISLGIDAKRIETKGYGESKPLVPNTTAKNKSLNRRVVATIIN
jgi:OOP family OmpA-OmpF porin